MRLWLQLPVRHDLSEKLFDWTYSSNEMVVTDISPLKMFWRTMPGLFQCIKMQEKTFNAKNATRASSFERKFSSLRTLLWVLMALRKLKAVESLNLSPQGSSVTVAEMVDVLQTTKVTQYFSPKFTPGLGSLQSILGCINRFYHKKTETFGFLLWYSILHLYQNIGFLQDGISRHGRCVCHNVWLFFLHESI